MFIRSVELEDIKSHTESKFEFRKGTTAIIGDNGAGKTTIIEAIAWTLFDLLDYKKDAFLRRGAKRGVARVTIESEADERSYVIHRDTGTGYYVYDPAIKTRVADKKDEVQRFLRQHMGVEPGTDLETLFRSAIGVPQGTFTSIFLETPAARKREFDRLLKVEEYRRSSEKLIDTVNHIKGQLTEIENRISFSKGKLADYDSLRNTLKELKAEEKLLTADLKRSEKESAKLRAEVEKFEKTESRIRAAREELEKITEGLTKEKVGHGTAKARFEAATAAAEKLEKAKVGHEKHLKALGMLKELERERGERERLNKQISEIEQALARVRVERERNEKELEKVLLAHKRVEELKPKVAEQKELERKREEIRNKVTEAGGAEARLKSIDAELRELRGRYKEISSDLKTAAAAREEAEKLPGLVAEDDRLRERIAELKGRLENDRRFQAEVKNGLCPILTEKCLNLKEGQSLEGFLSSQFSELSEKAAEAEAGRKRLSAALATARKAESAAARFDPLKRSEEEIAGRGKRLNDEKEQLEKASMRKEDFTSELKETEAALEKLGNPEATVRILEEDAGKEIPLREAVTKSESNLERLESDRRLNVEQLDNYKDLDFNWKKYSESRDKTADDHKTYIANEEAAAQKEELKKALDENLKRLEKLEKKSGLLTEKIEKESEGFDREEFARKKAELSELDRTSAALKANLDNASKRRGELDQQLAALEEHRERLKADELEKKRLDKVLKTTVFIRTTLKEAAPRVARNYVHHVSIEANQMYREITGIAEHTLKWEDDYGVALEEGGFDRPFQNLSGGEQMAAALSIRLALLRQLSDISLAFFDEPTTNLDLERRERLAEQISRITESGTFDQLFVISHDDTFEGYVDNVITIEQGEFEQG